MTVQYLIDSENVGDFWIPLLDLPAEETELIVFYTRNSPHMSYESLIRLKESNRTVTFIKCYEGTNALDFQLVSELGYRICENEEDRFVIVTNDTGFDAAVKYWRRRKKSVKRITGKEAKNPERRIREDLSSRHAGEKVSGAEKRVPVRRYTAVEHDSDHDAHADAFHAEAAQDPDGRPSRANLRDAEIAAQPEFEETASTEESSFDTGEDLELDAYEPEDEALNEEAWAEDTADDLVDADADDFEDADADDFEDADADDFEDADAEDTADVLDDAFADAEDTADGFDGAFTDAEDIEDDFEDADAEDLLDPDTEDYAEPEETAEYVEEPARDLTAEDPLEKTGSAESLIEEPVERAASQAQIAQAYADMWEEDTETGTVSGEVPGVGDTALLIESQQLDFIAQVAPVPEGSPEIEEGPDAGRDAQVEYSASEEPTAVSAAEEPTAESAAEDSAAETQHRSRSRRSRSRRSRSSSKKQEQTQETETEKTAEESVRQETPAELRENPEAQNAVPVPFDVSMPPVDEEIARIVACIGADNLAELHNQLATFYGDQGKDIYLSIKNNTRSLPVLKPDLKQKFTYYCEIIFVRSDYSGEYPADISEFLLSVREKLNNLNSLRYALQKHYGKEKGRRFYFLLKPFAKTMYQM